MPVPCVQRFSPEECGCRRLHQRAQFSWKSRQEVFAEPGRPRGRKKNQRFALAICSVLETSPGSAKASAESSRSACWDGPRKDVLSENRAPYQGCVSQEPAECWVAGPLAAGAHRGRLRGALGHTWGRLEESRTGQNMYSCEATPPHRTPFHQATPVPGLRGLWQWIPALAWTPCRQGGGGERLSPGASLPC